MFYLDINDGKVSCENFVNEDRFVKYLSHHITFLENNPDFFKKTTDNTTVI